MSAPARGAATLHDVAREAGVSLATASRVLNGSTRKVAQSYRDRVEVAARQIPVRPRAPHELEKLHVFVGTACRLGDDLLCEDVQRRFVRDDRIQFAAPHGSHERSAFDEVVA